MAESSASSATPASSAPATPAAAPKAPAAVDPKAVGTPATPAKAAPVVEDMWDVQVEGKTEKRSKKEILEAYQLRQLSDKKRSEADKTLAEATKFFQAFKSDPVKAMKAMGMDFDGLSTQYLAKKAEEAMMDPKERELQQARQKAEMYEKQMAERQAAEEKAAKDAEVSTVRQQIHKEIIDTIESKAKEYGLPVDERLVIAVAQEMMLQDRKKKPLNAQEALTKAHESSRQYLQGLASKMDGESLVKWMGPEVAMKIRKYDLAQLKAKRQTPVPQARVEPKVEPQSAQPKYKTWSQFKAEKLDTIK